MTGNPWALAREHLLSQLASGNLWSRRLRSFLVSHDPRIGLETIPEVNPDDFDTRGRPLSDGRDFSRQLAICDLSRLVIDLLGQMQGTIWIVELESYKPGYSVLREIPGVQHFKKSEVYVSVSGEDQEELETVIRYGSSAYHFGGYLVTQERWKSFLESNDDPGPWTPILLAVGAFDGEGYLLARILPVEADHGKCSTPPS